MAMTNSDIPVMLLVAQGSDKVSTLIYMEYMHKYHGRYNERYMESARQYIRELETANEM